MFLWLRLLRVYVASPSPWCGSLFGPKKSLQIVFLQFWTFPIWGCIFLWRCFGGVKKGGNSWISLWKGIWRQKVIAATKIWGAAGQLGKRAGCPTPRWSQTSLPKLAVGVNNELRNFSEEIALVSEFPWMCNPRQGDSGHFVLVKSAQWLRLCNVLWYHFLRFSKVKQASNRKHKSN